MRVGRFERWEYRLLWRTLCKRIKTARDKRTKASRELLRVYVLVLANSGIRTGEANKLKVTDVHPFKDDKQRHNYRLVVRGKTGERDAVVRSVAAKRLDKFLAIRRAADPGGLLFVMPDGSPVVTLIDQLTSALKEAGIERNSFGEKYSVYSLRHFYAVNALRNGVGVFEVARNMGTSVQMIQEYYRKQATSALLPAGMQMIRLFTTAVADLGQREPAAPISRMSLMH